MTDDSIEEKALEIALDDFDNMGRIGKARVFLSLALLRAALWFFPRSLEDVAESAGEVVMGSLVGGGMGSLLGDGEPSGTETFDMGARGGPTYEHAEEKPCGEVHPLPCGVDKSCPETESYDAET